MRIIDKIAECDKEINKIATADTFNSKSVEFLSALYCAKKALFDIENKSNINSSIKAENAKMTANNQIKSELDDIMPALQDYFNSKNGYRKGIYAQEKVNHDLQRLVVEINEFIAVLKSNTCCDEERQILTGIHL